MYQSGVQSQFRLSAVERHNLFRRRARAHALRPRNCALVGRRARGRLRARGRKACARARLLRNEPCRALPAENLNTAMPGRGIAAFGRESRERESAKPKDQAYGRARARGTTGRAGGWATYSALFYFTILFTPKYSRKAELLYMEPARSSEILSTYGIADAACTGSVHLMRVPVRGGVRVKVRGRG